MKKFMCLAIGIVLSSFFACNRNTPEKDEITPTNSYAYIQKFFPYSLGEPLVFKNTSSGELWKVNPNDRFKDGIFPEFNLHDINPSSKSPTVWHCSGFAEFLINEQNYTNGLLRISQNITSDLKMGTIGWSVVMQLSDSSELIEGMVNWVGPTNEMYSVLRDTAIIFMGHAYSIRIYDGDTTIIGSQVNTDVGENAYARIVKGQGITDFCIDGQTIWRREK